MNLFEYVEKHPKRVMCILFLFWGFVLLSIAVAALFLEWYGLACVSFIVGVSLSRSWRLCHS